MAARNTTPEEIGALMRKFVKEVQEGGNISLIDELIHPDFHDHTPGRPVPPGREGPRAVIQAIHAGLSKIKIEIIHLTATGNVVSTHKILYGTRTGQFMGQPPTGERIQMRIMDVVTFEDGMFREHWATLGPVTAVKEE